MKMSIQCLIAFCPVPDANKCPQYATPLSVTRLHFKSKHLEVYIFMFTKVTRPLAKREWMRMNGESAFKGAFLLRCTAKQQAEAYV